MAAHSRAAQTSTGERLMRTPVALTIAGSDSGGGAGIQADLKAFARCGVHGASAITALTAQNTEGVSAVHTVPPDFVLEQVRAVVRDIGVDAVKVGMLGTAEIAHAVAQALDELPPGTPVVVDPVMVAESGAQLLDPDAQGALVAQILPRATVLTPNLLEARVLAGVEPAGAPAEGDGRIEGAGESDGRSAGAVEGAGESDGQSAGAVEGAGESDGRSAGAVEGAGESDDEAEALARAVLALGPGSVVLTGGHRTRAVDLFVTGSQAGEASAGGELVVELHGERHPGGAAHGSGCTHSSVLAAQLALGRTPLEAARVARRRAGEAVARGLRDIGAGAGPVDVLDLAARRGVA
jgi:hydroxymethylpyrimidine/phosphomethylpyrimidine kinase